MSVISFASLKGGVGKTSLSLNVAHAFAMQGNSVLLIDCDPAAHASRFFRNDSVDSAIRNSSLAKLFLSLRTKLKKEDEPDILEAAEEFGISLIFDVRENLSLLPGSSDLHHFLWGPGAKVFKRLFPLLVDDFKSMFDIIIFDTCPDFNVVTRNVIANSDAVIVPVDSSEMSISSLEEIFKSSQHIKGPRWAIARTMVLKKAARVQRLTASRLGKSQELLISGISASENLSEDNGNSFNDFISQVKMVEKASSGEKESLNAKNASSVESENSDPRDIFLLDTVVHRTEQQNRLSFLAKTAFDSRETKKLADEYASVAKELELLLGMENDSFLSESSEDFSSLLIESSPSSHSL